MQDGTPITARVAILGADGRSYAPDNANVRGDDSFDRDKQAFETHYYQTKLKPAPVTLPAGKASITIWYGDEHHIARETANIVAGQDRDAGREDAKARPAGKLCRLAERRCA